ncbi:MAG: hypothetical protein ACTH2N_11760, partial [Brachybacterium tyrofermentans]
MSLRPKDLRLDTVYRREELLAQGMHRRHFASAAMRRVLPGWWVRAEADVSLRQLAAIVQSRLRPGTVISHESAAELFGFPLPRQLTYAGGAPIHCRGPANMSRTAGTLVIAHLPSREPTLTHRSLVISHPLVALQEIATRLSHVELVVCLDALAADQFGTELRMRRSQIEQFVASSQGPGAPALRQALPHLRERSWSPMETKLRLQLLGRGFPEPSLNVEVVESTTGNRFYIDLAYEDEKIAIEYDSEAHRKDVVTWQKDVNKNDVLHDAGWKVIRATIADYRKPAEFFARLEDALRRRRPSVA